MRSTADMPCVTEQERSKFRKRYRAEQRELSAFCLTSLPWSLQKHHRANLHSLKAVCGKLLEKFSA